MKKINDTFICSLTGDRIISGDTVMVDNCGFGRNGVRFAEFVDYNATLGLAYVKFGFDRKSTPVDPKNHRITYAGEDGE